MKDYNIGMDLVNYLFNIYGYDKPIFIKDVRIGRKSKSAIREEFYRATKNGKLERDSQGVYFIKSDKEFGNVITFEQVIAKKYIYSDDAPEGFEKLFIEGYYSGLTFQNMIHISPQVPAILEITTNKTSSKKRFVTINGRMAIIRKSRVKITFQNCDMLQFLEMFRLVDKDDIKENKKLLIDYIKNKQLTKTQFSEYIGLFGTDTIKKIVEGGLIHAFI